MHDATNTTPTANKHGLRDNSYKRSHAGSMQWRVRTSLRQTPKTNDFGKLGRRTHRGTNTGRSLHVGVYVASHIQGLTLTQPSCRAVTTAARLQICAGVICNIVPRGARTDLCADALAGEFTDTWINKRACKHAGAQNRGQATWKGLDVWA